MKLQVTRPLPTEMARLATPSDPEHRIMALVTEVCGGHWEYGQEWASSEAVA